MKSEYINLELNADEYEFLTLCSRVYHIALEDWLLAAAIIRGHHVGFSRRVLEIRWKLFFWDFFLNLKSSWMPATKAAEPLSSDLEAVLLTTQDAE